MNLIPTILCGGAGSRLWPVSRETHPKPFIRLQDGESLLQKAFIRAAKLEGAAEVLTVTNRELFFKTEDAYREVNPQHMATSFILEPFGRNTAAAIAAAVLQIERTHGPDAILLVLAADHLITDHPAFQVAVKQACLLAQQGQLVTFGIQPEAPETGFGYIEAEGTKVLRFVEKPNLEKAREYLKSGRFLWNSGMFCFTVSTMLKALETHCPEILAATKACMDKSRNTKGEGFSQLELDPILFDVVPDDSIDFAVMEKAKNVSVVPCTIGWSDIGSWSAMSDVAKPDQNGNRILGEVMLHEVTNCYIQGHDRMIGAVGIDDLIIVDTADAVLVAKKTMAQNVKHLYAELKANGHDAHKLHRTVLRPWGSYTIIDEGENFKSKRIVVKPGGSLSLQMHHHRSEHWIVTSGVASVVNGEQNLTLHSNQSTYIKAGDKHRLENHGSEDVVMIEVQCGGYLGEDDIVRFQDIYGRA